MECANYYKSVMFGEGKLIAKTENPKMKKRTKITLRTKIYLTIVGLLALTGFDGQVISSTVFQLK